MAELLQQSDEQLMVRICDGDHQAFATLVRRHNGKFYAAAYRMCSRQDEAEDIVQEAFLKLWDKPDAYDARRGAKFTTWFYRVVTNLAVDKLRKLKPSYGTEVLERLQDNAPRADMEMEAQEEKSYIEDAIETLPERQRIALNLCFYEGLSNKEAADILGVGVKALESMLMRAKAGLRDELIRQGYIEREKEYG